MQMDNTYTDYALERAVTIGRYVAQSGDTVRGAAKIFNVSKSTAHKDLTVRLKYEDADLYSQVMKVLQKNKSERHLRGGAATREKYKNKKKK